MTSNPLHDPDLHGLVSAALELRDRGIEPPLEELCRARPDLLDAVSDAIEIGEQLPRLQRETVTQDPWVGTVLDARYHLSARLGSGAMGVVYSGEDLELKRRVAVKLLRMAFLTGDQAEERFAREAEALAAIAHPAVVTVHDRGNAPEGAPYLVMEFLEGLPLDRLLDEGRRRAVDPASQDTSWIAEALGVEALDEPAYLRTVVRWVADLANGLSAAHERGILHRDVKPSNVFVEGDGRVVLLDFGIAAQNDQATLTRDGSLIGTPAYLAPEALEQERRPAEALDVYGLAATLYHMLTFQPPYRGTPSQVLAELASKEPVPVRKLREQLPRDLQAVVEMGMARRPADRYGTMAEFEADLRAFLDYQPVKARPMTRLRRTARRFRRSPVFWTLLAASAVTVGSVRYSVWQDARTSSRAAAFAELRSHFLPNRFILDPRNRRLHEAADPAGALRRLDESVELSADRLPVLVRRALFRVDHGDARGATEDIARIDAELETPLSAALLAAYRALPADATGVDLDFSALPEPESALDHYVAGVHLWRTPRKEEGLEHLRDARLDEHVPTQELLSIFGDPMGRLEHAQWLEEQTGRTATTCLRKGLALHAMRRYEDAYDAYVAGIALAPESYLLHNNAARAAALSNRPLLGEDHYERCLELNPGYAKGVENYVWLLIDQRRPEDGARLLEREGAGLETEQRVKLAGLIEVGYALRCHVDGESTKAAAHASRAIDRFEAAGLSLERFLAAEVSRGMLERKDQVLFSATVEMSRADPLSDRRLELLLTSFPETLDAPQTELVRRYLASLQRTLAARRQAASPDPRYPSR